jgi:hypothetical protein
LKYVALLLTGLPDDIFAYQKYFWYVLEGIGIVNIVWPFAKFKADW